MIDKLNTFSICIPTNRINQRLLNTLKNVTQDLDYPTNRYNIHLLLDGVEDDFSYPDISIHYNKISKGVSNAKNIVLSKGDNDWLVLLDSDDYLVPSALSQYNIFLNNGNTSEISVVYELPFISLFKKDNNDVTIMYPNKEEELNEFFKTSRYDLKSLNDFKNLNFSGRSILFNKNNYLGFDEKYSYCEDRKILFDNLKNNKKIFLMPTCSYVFNINDEGISKGLKCSKIENNIKDKENIIKEINNYEIPLNFDCLYDKFYITERDFNYLKQIKNNERTIRKKNNTAIVTMTLGDLYTELSEITHPSIINYANKIGSDFIIISENREFKVPHYKKLELESLLDVYERILFVDTDIVIRGDSPNIFEDVSSDELGIFEEGQFTDRYLSTVEYMKKVGFDYTKWNKKYYNTGVMILSKIHKNLFIKPIEEIEHFGEQTYLNTMISFLKPKIKNIHYKFNRMSCMDQITGEERYDCYFMHYAGIQNILEKDKFFNLIKDDLKQWNKDRPKYRYKKNVAIICEGGMGDQISAIPTCKYIIEQVYAGDNIVIQSHWPIFFKHLGVPVYLPGQKVENNKGYHILHTLRNPEHISWEFMSHPLVHAVNFASLQALRCELPDAYKQIQIDRPSEEIYHKLEERIGCPLKSLILLHPGRGWYTKTFPSDVWSSWAEILHKKGYKVAIIGKHISEEQGIVDFDKSKYIDLVNKLSVEELIAIISKAPILITNDSAPLWIAGAFDNWIGLIATCKHPDYIMPYRNGSKTHKIAKLERDTLYNDFSSQPTQVYGATIDKCTEERLRKCLPKPLKILEFVKEIDLYYHHGGIST